MSGHVEHPYEICLAFALRDAPGDLLPKARRILPALEGLFSGLAALVTTDTHSDWSSFLSEQQVPITQDVPDWDHIGRHRRLALELAVGAYKAPYFLYADIDHLLRWQERDPEGLRSALAQIPSYDCLVIGRTAAGFAAAPRRLQLTETLVNEVFRLISGCSWDTMMGNRGLSRRAALRIVEASRVDTIGNDVAWPLMLMCEGFDVGYVEGRGLSYETNPVYANDTQDADDGDPSAWMLRVYAANQHVDAMRAFLKDSHGE